jgi:hypothetical protein
LALKALKDSKVLSVLKVRKECRVLLALKVLSERKVHKVFKVLLEHKAHKVFKEHRVYREPQVLLVDLTRKYCSTIAAALVAVQT